MKLLKPPKLNVGDTIGIIAPSHPILPFQGGTAKGLIISEDLVLT
ncbi:MAG: hypothetical protein QMD23_04400 [Candidatus Bathyarchaeia archaeon]|nr:hypothetical protein [Candidatus Bathyarchaeia archaeon]